MTQDERDLIECLFSQMYQPLLSYALGSLKNESLAEEAVQETFRIACLKSGDMYNSPNPKGWLTKVLKNTIRNTKRTCAHAELFLREYLSAQGKEAVCSEDALDLSTLYGDISDSEEFCLIWEMAVEGRSHLEMAQKRGISVNACKKRVERAKKYLKKKINMSLFK